MEGEIARGARAIDGRVAAADHGELRLLQGRDRTAHEQHGRGARDDS